MDIKNFKSLESLQTARDFENMLRLLCKLPKLNVSICGDGKTVELIDLEDDDRLAKVLTDNGELAVAFKLDK